MLTVRTNNREARNKPQPAPPLACMLRNKF
jgi:hypothetical protein